jgi:hypothetical protein
MPLSGQVNPALGTYSFNAFAAGRKKYRGGSTFAPTMGQVDRAGYMARESRNAAKLNAYQRWLKAKQQGNFASSDSLRLEA